MSKRSESNKYIASKADGRIDLVCSIDDKIAMATAPIKDKTADAIEARVWGESSRLQRTKRTN